jgi:hypothetical protein
LLAIAGGILWRKNAGAHVRVSEKDGAGGNVIWFRVGVQRYALLYSHRARRIELMFGGRRGHMIHTFTNHTPLAEVAQVFATLGMSEEETQAYLAARAELKAKFPKGNKTRTKKAKPEVVEATAAAPVHRGGTGRGSRPGSGQAAQAPHDQGDAQGQPRHGAGSDHPRGAAPGAGSVAGDRGGAHVATGLTVLTPRASAVRYCSVCGAAA